MKVKTQNTKSTSIISKLILLALFFLIVSCNHQGKLKHEKGIVVEKQYFPDTQETVTGTGFSTSGNMVITSHNIGGEEKYIVIFKCEHGVLFSVNKSELYGALNKNDSVRIEYYEILDSDNKLVGFDFVSAVRE